MELLLNSFKKVVNRFPDHVAVVEQDRSVSYACLNQFVDTLTYWLECQGLSRGDRVAIHLPNSIDYIAVYYACWGANLVPVALNTLASPYEITNWVEHCECKLIFSNKLKQENFPVPVLSLSTDTGGIRVSGDKIDSADTSIESVSGSLIDVATIIYTSGTTGNPKGITLLHSNLAANVQAIVKSLSIVDDDVFLCVLPFFYSYGNSILHTHLISGATLVLLNQVAYPGEILKAIERHLCTGFAGVPSIYISLLKKTSFSNHRLGSLRYMTQAGGHLSGYFISRLRQSLPAVDFVIMYGQTEASARISYLPPNFLENKLGSVGIGLDGTTITIEDPDGNECTAEEKGEICVQGENLMQGYWQNAAATAQVLKDGKLHTGDMGYKDEDGFLFIIGRQSEILKISEHRVSPYEIEEVLMQHEAVEECAVIGCSHAQMGQSAKAFVVRSSDQVVVNQLKKYCKQFLAGYKIPKEIEFVSSLPKTSSGKIKRAELSC
jgi:acyl-CoA synthetase (AMP-forming)/AMP-acid ligase II